MAKKIKPAPGQWWSTKNAGPVTLSHRKGDTVYGYLTWVPVGRVKYSGKTAFYRTSPRKRWEEDKDVVLTECLGDAP